MRRSDHIERRLKLHDLRVLITAAQSGSMLKAAHLLNTSQPAVSRSISELENTLGVRLLDRSRQGVAPTIYGQALLDCGAAVFDDLRQGVKKIEFLADPTEGELRIGSGLPGFGGVVPATIARFRRSYLRIQIQANILTDPQKQHRALRERTIDFFVGRLPQPIEKDLEFEILFQEGLVVVAGAHNRWARHRKIRLAELVAEPWLLPPFETSAVGSLIAQAFRASGLEVPKNRIMTDAVLFMQSLVANGDFLSCYSSSPMRLGTVGLGLKVLPVHLPVPRSPFGILRLKNRMLSPAAELFIQHAREVAKPLAKGK